MEQSQSQYQGPERRQSQSPYQGKERRRLDWPFQAPRTSGMSTQERKDEQAERAREQQKEQGDRT